MRILVDISHPAHVHLFKNFIWEIKTRNFEVIVTVKTIPAAMKLLDAYAIPYINIGVKSNSMVGKMVRQAGYDWALYKIAKKNRVKFALGSSITIAHVSRFTNMKSFVFDDDDSNVEPLFVKFGHPFSDLILTPECLAFENYGKKHITYAGYHELAYLHPNRFQPDASVLTSIGLTEDDTFFVLRFNSFRAHHDIGAKGISLGNKRRLVNLLKSYGKILITTEGEIDPEFSEYQIGISPAKIHSLLYYATIFIGDSQTMTSEAAVLGTPSVRSNTFVGRISYLEEQENRYGLTFGFLPDKQNEMMQKISELLKNPDLRDEWQKRRKRMLTDKIDVTAFLVWFVENYPASVEIMRNNPDYQYRFR